MKRFIVYLAMLLLFAGCAAFSPYTRSPYEHCTVECKTEYQSCIRSADYSLNDLLKRLARETCMKRGLACMALCKKTWYPNDSTMSRK